ncbi:MAG: hypothetical protein HQ477_10715 [Chloroflexi bacterium]|nr:hypothetical protein [Chloroflexota bacterium]
MKLELDDGSRIAVIGGGPAGAMFSYFLLTFANRMDMDLKVDIYEPRDFALIGPPGCNMCGGIVSESLIQMLATEGIRLPETVIQRGIDSYVLHTDESSVRINTPLAEQRIATVHRGGGPRDADRLDWGGLDGYLLDLAESIGANVIHDRVSAIERSDTNMIVSTRRNSEEYDLAVGATGANSTAWKLYEKIAEGELHPELTRAYITEVKLGRDKVDEMFGSSLHIFLLNIPNLDFAAIVPKGDYATVALLGGITEDVLDQFFSSESVRNVFPGIENIGEGACHCSPRMNTGAAPVAFADRFVMVGDSGVSRLNKDGIGAAYRTAKAAALTAAFRGISAADFEKGFSPTYDTLANDNGYGKFMFGFVHKARRMKPLMRGIIGMTSREQKSDDLQKKMSMALWDLFTGSAPYRDVFYRMINPSFALRLGYESAKSIIFKPSAKQSE